MGLFASKKFLFIGLIAVLLAAIPLTMYLVFTPRETRTRAVASTTLAFSPTSATAAVGEDIPFNIMVTPNQNIVSFVKLIITYDPTKLQAADGSLAPNTEAFPSVIEAPTYESGKITVTLSSGVNPDKLIQTPTQIATVTFKALAETQTPTQIAFGAETQVLSYAQTDSPSENVLATKTPALVTIGAGSVTPTTGATTPTPTTSQTTNQIPVCTSITAQPLSGNAPLLVTFTVNGNDPDGTITKVTFNFGDGTVEDKTEAGGIGTDSVSIQNSHTYNSQGPFNATAVLTDDENGVSSASCSQTINVNVTAVGSGATPSATPIPQPIIEQPGASDTILKIGILGAVLSILGGLVFFAL